MKTDLVRCSLQHKRYRIDALQLSVRRARGCLPCHNRSYATIDRLCRHSPIARPVGCQVHPPPARSPSTGAPETVYRAEDERGLAVGEPTEPNARPICRFRLRFGTIASSTSGDRFIGILPFIALSPQPDTDTTDGWADTAL